MALDADAFVAAAASAGSVFGAAGVAWWLIAPRVRDYLEQIVLETLQVTRAQVDLNRGRIDGHDITLARHEERLDLHRDRLDKVERAPRRGPVELLELVDLVELLQRHRPNHPSLTDLRALEKEERER